ncbi:MAG TPA: DUF6531 domain-containing protein [Candidatus Rubrimentiphilum sp.]|nr:DUF6531 domain-containing protein [Candidatus Rubrimentiphilum sp.]
MPRFVILAFAILFTTQSTGASALAATAQGGQVSLFAQVRMDLGHIVAAAAATHIGALLTGNADRWNAMHAPPPVFPRTIPKPANPEIHAMHPLPPVRTGIKVEPPFPRMRPIAPKDAPPDPLAMKRTVATFGSARGGIMRKAQAVPTLLKPMSINSANSAGTGINPWWTYEEGAIPGVGKYMVNVASGNLIVQEDDVDIPERGIDLAFRRTYNSQSLHDSAGSDGGVPSNYGDGWTNNFDVHLAYNGSNVVTVYDLDGARYDYTSDGQGNWVAPAGQHAVLIYTGNCQYQWQKKNGTVYVFWSPAITSCPGGSGYAGYAGRTMGIYARNHNNNITFGFGWDNGDPSSAAHLVVIYATHSDGQTLSLHFTDFSGHRELAWLTRPDSVMITYSYDSSGDLSGVTEATNNSAYGYHQYNWWPGQAHQLIDVLPPRWAQSGAADGADTWFYFDGSNRVVGIQLYGYPNFTPDDGTGTALQPSYSTGARTMAYTTFSYPSTGETDLTDVDGHATNWFYDTVGRNSQTRDWTGSQWLVTYASWDSNNNLTESIDVRNQATDYAYDSNGNTVAVGLPSVSTNQGTFRPTTLYSYDRTNNADNIVAVCDPIFAHSHGQDWTSNPGTSDSLCPSQSGTTRYTWDYSDASEPFGRLSNSYTPLGYHRAYSYDSGAQGGDFGLPTSVVGDTFTQNDGTSRSPTQQFIYDGYGNLVCFSKLQDGSGTHWSRLTYDSLNRQTAVADPDDATLTVSQCSNSPGISGSYIVSSTTYYQNGQVASTQSPSEHASYGVSTTFTYDSNGNQIGQAGGYGPTQKWYDGADRLVEVVEPTSGSVYGSLSADLFPWLTRYIYDMSQNNQVSMQYGGGYYAHGNLFKTQRYVPAKLITVQSSYGTITTMSASRKQAAAKTAESTPAPSSLKPSAPILPRGSMRLPKALTPLTLAPRASLQTSPSAIAPRAIVRMSQPSGTGGQWMDVSGTAFDSLDRKSAEYHYIPGSDSIGTHSYTYDSGAAGLLVSETMPVGDSKTYTYDNAGRLGAVSFAVSSSSTYTAGRSYTYDPDGRVASVGNSEFGTWNYNYDADGRLSSLAEPAGGGSGIPGSPYSNSGTLTSPSTYLYSYYGNGWASQVQVQGSNAATQQESYRSDGLPQTDYYSTIPGSITRQYTPAGRITNRTDPSGSDSTTYDGYGRLATQSVPSGTYANFTYNDQGLPTDYRIYPVSGSYSEVQSDYTATGQLACKHTIDGPCNWYFDGTPIPNAPSYYAPDGNQYSNNAIVDTRNLLAVGTAVEDGSGNVVVSGSNAYDANTRITQTVSMTTYDDGRGDWQWVWQTQHTYQYDGEDHTTSVSDVAAVTSTITASHSYAWGPNGHPVTVGMSCNSGLPICGQMGGWHYNGLHWNGDALAFETRADSSVSDYKLGLDGDVLSGTLYNGNASGYSGATYYDRDASGATFADHNASGHSLFASCNGGPIANTPGPNNLGCGGGTAQQPGYYDASSGIILSYQRRDGITDGSANIQGVRNYSSETSQWTTPDAYAGEIHDPMSQAKYMWNRNNPLAYHDPSGYDVLIDLVPGGAGGLGHIELITYDPKTGKGWLLSAESSTGAPFGSTIGIHETRVSNVNSLPTEGHHYYHVSTSTAQDNAIKSVYDQHDKASKQGEHYNLLTNNCETTAQQALDKGRVDVGLSGIPNVNRLLPAVGVPEVLPNKIRL